eukprot:7572974-Lingulodinium_polyedra.AAC.1
MALYGRTPNMLPSLSLSEAAADDSTGTFVGPTRHVHRVREFDLQSMIEGIARARALSERSTLARRRLGKL